MECLWNVSSFTVLTLLPDADNRTLSSSSVCMDDMTGGVCGRLVGDLGSHPGISSLKGPLLLTIGSLPYFL